MNAINYLEKLEKDQTVSIWKKHMRSSGTELLGRKMKSILQQSKKCCLYSESFSGTGIFRKNRRGYWKKRFLFKFCV